MSYVTPQHITPFPFWNQFTPTLPSLYWDVDSHEERIKRICLELHKLIEYADYLGENINLDHETIEQLQADFQKFIDGAYDDFYETKIAEWIDEHFADILKSVLNHGVFFGLTDDGYLCANVVWQLTIYFDTIMDYSSDDYGRLVLNY